MVGRLPKQGFFSSILDAGFLAPHTEEAEMYEGQNTKDSSNRAITRSDSGSSSS
jgi:hypothetical protein